MQRWGLYMRCSALAGCRIDRLMLWMISWLQYLIRRWWLTFHLISSGVCSSHSLQTWSSGMLATSFCMPSLFWILGNAERCFHPSARCHGTSSYPSSWSNIGHISTPHASQTGSKDDFVHLFKGNPECRTRMAQWCDCSMECRGHGMFPPMGGGGGGWVSDSAIFSTRSREGTRQCLRLNIC